MDSFAEGRQCNERHITGATWHVSAEANKLVFQNTKSIYVFVVVVLLLFEMSHSQSVAEFAPNCDTF